MDRYEARINKWEKIVDELKSRNIDFKVINNNSYKYNDTLIELIKVDGQDMFGLFMDDNCNYLICEGDCLTEINYRLSVKHLVDNNIKELSC